MLDLRALTHEFAPGTRVTCRMEGDTFEMEDQRNWTDASYKTYVRPLALPWPYTLAAGTELDQEVSLTVHGRPTDAAHPAGAPIAVAIESAAGTMPPIGIGLDPDEHVGALVNADKLRALGVAHVVCHYDPRRGHDHATLAKAAEVARAIGGEPWLEAVIARVDGWEEEVTALGAAARAIGSPFGTVLISPASDLKSTLPGGVWPPSPPAEALFKAARSAFPDVRLGGGMFSYFTELNRKRPPIEHLDLVSFTTCPIVHAGDDRTVLENLELLPAIAASVRAFIGDRPFHVGPSAIGMRANPYGAAPMANPNGIRQAMSRVDPRQRGLLNAAWTLGHVARLVAGGASALTLGGAVGAAGVLHARADYPQPFFDMADGGLFPVFHVLRGLAALKGATRLGCAVSRPHDLQALAVARDGRTEIWLANLTTDALTVRIAAPGAARVAMLAETNFPEAAASPRRTRRCRNGVSGRRPTAAVSGGGAATIQNSPSPRPSLNSDRHPGPGPAEGPLAPWSLARGQAPRSGEPGPGTQRMCGRPGYCFRRYDDTSFPAGSLVSNGSRMSRSRPHTIALGRRKSRAITTCLSHSRVMVLRRASRSVKNPLRLQ